MKKMNDFMKNLFLYLLYFYYKNNILINCAYSLTYIMIYYNIIDIYNSVCFENFINIKLKC
jgi:hypothetical protein